MLCIQNKICFDGCPVEYDSACVIYTGIELSEIGVNTDDTLAEILEEINDTISFTRTPFTANSTNSVYAIGGGPYGHSPAYNVRINPGVTNLITVSGKGLKIVKDTGGDGKVKVDSADPKAYLESQFAPTSDENSILTITPQTVSGKIKFTPTFNAENLLIEIEAEHITQFCEIISDCISRSE